MPIDMVTAKCIEKGWIVKYDFNQWIFTAYLTNMFRDAEKEIISEIAQPLGFKEWIFPTIISSEMLKKYGNKNINPIKTSVDYILDPLRISLYPVLKKMQNSYPLKVYERSTVYRSEIDENTFARSNTFRRIDMFYIGNTDDVLNCKDLIMNSFCDYFVQRNIKYRLKTGEDKLAMEFISNNLEIANIGAKKNIILRRFGIKDKNLWSGYASFGTDRLVYLQVKKELQL